MKVKRAEFRLRVAFAAGAVTDAVALFPMLFPWAAKLLWGFDTFSDQYRFAMGLGAVLMAAWTILLVWGCFKPLERRMIAPMTVLIVLWFLAVEIVAIANGTLAFDKALFSMILQAALSALFAAAFVYSRPANLKTE